MLNFWNSVLYSQKSTKGVKLYFLPPKRMTNYLAEQGLVLMTEFNFLLAKDLEKKQYILHVVEH